VVFPELSLTGYSLGRLADDVSLEALDADVAPLLDGDHRTAAVVGFAEAGRLHTYHSAAYLHGGDVRHVHRKLYLPTLDAVRRRRHEMSLVKEARLALLARRIERPCAEGGDL
jgi:predicted amidohydrolase